MSKTLLVICAATVIGLLMGLGMELVLSRPKAHDYPGFSGALGAITGLRYAEKLRKSHVFTAVIGGVSGIMGWALYCLLFPL